MTDKLSPGPDFRNFVIANTQVTSLFHVPEIRLHLANEAHDLWKRTEEELQTMGLQPPFWAFAWPGGQALARYVLDHPEAFVFKRVLDFASGSGIVAIAAAMTGSSGVLACDIDPFAAEAAALNAALNMASIEQTEDNLVGTDGGWDIILAGDVFYDNATSATLTPWFDALAARGAEVLIGDPGRAYLPRDRIVKIADYQVKGDLAVDDFLGREASVWRWLASTKDG